MEGFILGWFAGQFVDFLVHLNNLRRDLQTFNEIYNNTRIDFEL